MGKTGGQPESIWDDFGGRHICDCVRVGVGLAVLWETATHRQRIHRSRWDAGRYCDVRVVVAGECLFESGRVIASARRSDAACSEHHGARAASPTTCGPRFEVSGDCPCRPMLVESFAITHAFLFDSGPTLTRPVGAARRHLRCRQHDYTRYRRGEVGAQVRTDRLVDSARARQLPSDEHRELMRDVADEAGSEAPLESHSQLEQRLALKRMKRLGVSAAEAIAGVRRDLPVVEAALRGGRAVTIVNGDHREQISWWDAYIERPLGRRPRVGDIAISDRDGSADSASGHGPELACDRAAASFEQLLDEISGVRPDSGAASFYEAVRRAGPKLAAARLEGALRQLAEENVVPSYIVEQILLDSGRRATVLDAWRALEPD